MRRRKDSWLNATQILKISGFDKPQRTRILEREVQKGEHEKVQGGYGKYQGTWIPYERGCDLAEQYGVKVHLAPILSYVAGSVTPPPAPKHATAASTRVKVASRRLAPKRVKPNPRPTVSVPSQASVAALQQMLSSEISDASIDDLPIDNSTSPNRTDSSLESDDDFSNARVGNNMAYHPTIPISGYSEQLLEFFTKPEIIPVPDFLRHPPADFDPNATIDDEGHTALHWASAMGLLTVVALLLEAGADINRVNHEAQTPIMRAVVFSNNYELRTFPQIVEHLQGSIGHVDRLGRTVFHHIAAPTEHRSKIGAARYYTEVLLSILSGSVPADQLHHLLNFQDSEGDTALNICARNGARKVWKVLMAYHANPHLVNKSGRSADEFMREHNEQQRIVTDSSSPIQPANHTTPNYLSQNHISETAINTTQKVIPKMSENLSNLASAYDAEFCEKEEDIKQAQTLLEGMRIEIESSKQQLAGMTIDEIDRQVLEAQAEADNLRMELLGIVERSQARGLANLVKEEEAKALAIRPDIETDLEMLVGELTETQADRRKMVEEIVELFAASGVGERMSEYRKLIAISCGLKAEDVDGVLDAIEEVLVMGDPSHEQVDEDML